MTPRTRTVLRHSLRSPLGKPARRVRLGLGLVSTLSLLATQTGLLPTDLPSLELHFQLNDYMTLLKFILFFNVVLLITFTTCSLMDGLNWRLYGTLAVPSEPNGERSPTGTTAPSGDRQGAPKIPAVIRLRLFFEFALPCLLGLYAIGTALRIMYLNYITFWAHP